MRKWQWIGLLSVALGSAYGYWYWTTPTSSAIEVSPFATITPQFKDDGDAEASEVIEPLEVDRLHAVAVQTPEPPIDDGPMPRVLLESGMEQPPRPDVEPGTKLRMPYAD